MTKRYKFLKEGFKSANGNHTWEIGKRYKYDGNLKLCNSGFHCSKGIYQAFSYVQGEILAQVECFGDCVKDKDRTKEVWSGMKVVKAWKWQKKDSVLLSIYAARLCLDNFEKVFPDDKRPREAIEAAERYVKKPTEKNRLAAHLAADSAARSAYLAYSAARSAADSAYLAYSVARSNIYKKLDTWMLNHIKNLEEIK